MRWARQVTTVWPEGFLGLGDLVGEGEADHVEGGVGPMSKVERHPEVVFVELGGGGAGGAPIGGMRPSWTQRARRRARGADPFSGFIEHQERTMVRLCTGGTLGSIAEATGVGSGASDAQRDVWRDIVARDAALIGEEFTRWMGRFLYPDGLRGITSTIAEGELFRADDEIAAVLGNAVVILGGLSGSGKRIITGYEPDSPAKAEQLRKNPRARRPGEN